MTIRIKSVGKSRIIHVPDYLVGESRTLVVKLLARHETGAYIVVSNPEVWEERVNRILEEKHDFLEKIRLEREISSNSDDVTVRGNEGAYWTVLPRYLCDKIPYGRTKIEIIERKAA
ncbi:MAG: hypothetical protein HY517_04355 [Candidatus Aenigmarchaeota archaeon]|nr:hypothetical protein [Candidatus Aenigmarchaeota archaeon]